MGQRRKHMLQTAFTHDIQPPADNQQIVRALGTRGGNIVEVEYPNGSTTLCMMPAKFNRKLWVRRGGFLIIEPSPEAEQDAGSRVTGTIAAVLYGEHVKQLKKMQGVWPEEFTAAAAAGAAASGEADLPLSGSNSGSEAEKEVDDSIEQPEAGSSTAAAEQRQSSCSRAAAGQQFGSSTAVDAGAGSKTAAAAAAAAAAADGSQQQEAAVEEEDEESSDDGLPPLQQINNRRVVHYAADSDSSEDETE